jgi:hypothetical protein
VTADDIKNRIAEALQPIVDEAAAAGMLVGGAIRVLEWEGRWVPRCLLTLRRTDPSAQPSVVDAADAPPPIGVPNGSFLSGDTCIKCGGCRMQQAGACRVCLDCGESGGCG